MPEVDLTQEQKDFLGKVKETATESTKEVVQLQMDEFKKNLPEYVSSDDMEKRLETFETAIKDNGNNEELKKSFGELEEAVKTQGLELKKLNEQEVKNDSSIEEKICKSLGDNSDVLKEFKTTDLKEKGLVITLKGTIIRSDVSGDTMAHRVPGIGEIQRRRTFMRSVFSAGRISPNNHGVIRYVDQSSRTNNAATISEGDAFPTSDIDWIERSIPVEKVGNYIKVSRESMDDIDFVKSEVTNELIRNTQLATDAQLLSGDGIAPNLKGLVTSATAFAAGNYAAAVQDAQLSDLIAAIDAQIQTASSYMPNAVLLHPDDFTKRFKLIKDAENNYVMVPFAKILPSGETVISNMLVIPNSGVTANTLYAGDFTRGTVYSSDQLQLEIGYDADDFTKDLVTIKARERMALLIRIVDNGAFRYVSNITTSLAAIDNAP